VAQDDYHAFVVVEAVGEGAGEASANCLVLVDETIRYEVRWKLGYGLVPLWYPDDR